MGETPYLIVDARYEKVRHGGSVVDCAVLVAVGMIAQVAFLSVWPGVPFLAVAVALSWVVGFDNKLDRKITVIRSGFSFGVDGGFPWT